jgi:arylsulfatase A-like enzyme
MNPRRFIIAVFFAVFTLLSGSIIAADRPNIVLIFADDLGWKDVGYQGSAFRETPHLDQLASESMTFSQGYAAAGNCAPSRACLLSGNYTPRHGVYAVGSTDRGQKDLQRLVPVPNRSGLAAANVTIADALKGAGYATGHFGKWHLGGKEGADPTEQGFDVSFDSFGEGAVIEGSEGNKAGPPEDPKGVYTLTRKACEFIEKHREGPFFVYLAHHAIHTPLQARPETLKKFQEKPGSPGKVETIAAACTYDLDDSVGIFLAKLKELGLEENTLLVFTSDNGAVQDSSQEPLRGSKGGYYEGGIREPFLVRWPGVVKAGSKSDVPVINIDLFPTFLAAAGASVPEGKTLDGESLLPVLKGESTLARESIFWHFPGYLDKPVNRGRELDVRTGFRSRPVSVIRQGDWKLHLFLEEWQLDGGRGALPGNHAVELYDLANDQGERVDLSSENAAKRDEMLDALLAWHQLIEAVNPTEANSSYDAAATLQKGEKRGRKGKGGGEE